MIKYPLYFKAAASSSPGIGVTWNSGAGELSPIDCAIPAEFNGPGSGYSPEDLMVMAVINCFIATFNVFAERSGFAFSSIEAEGVLEIGRDPHAKVGVTGVKVLIEVKKPSSSEKALALLNETKTNCLMANALKAPCEFTMRTS